MSSKRAGVLVLVLLAAVGTALLIPAVHPLRDRANRQETIDRMKTLAVAMHSCNDARRFLPPAYDSFADIKYPASVHVHLLPYLEQDSLYKSFLQEGKGKTDASVASFHAPIDPTLGDGAGVQNLAANLRVFSDIGVSQGLPGLSTPFPVTPVMPGTSAIPRSFPDGTSNTICFATKFAVCGEGGSHYGANPTSRFAAFFGANGAEKPAHRSDPQAIFQLAPEGSECLARPLMGQSFGPQGIMVAMGDGSVHTVSPTISPIAWNQALQPNEGMPLGTDWDGGGHTPPVSAAPFIWTREAPRIRETKITARSVEQAAKSPPSRPAVKSPSAPPAVAKLVLDEPFKRAAPRTVAPAPDDGHNTEAYEHRVDNPYLLAAKNPLSTFSIDVDTASYSNVRRYLKEQNQLPPRDAVRVEELVNYFRYDYPQPLDQHPFSVTAEVAFCPWNRQHQLVKIGLQGTTIPQDKMPARNLVFLLDTSGSMDAPNRLPLLQQALRLLTRQLHERDRVTIVAYAGSAGLVLPATPGNQHGTILDAIDRLHAEGSTNGGDGIVLAYRQALENFMEKGVNRVILGTDGDFNVGVTGSELIRLVEEKRKTGVFLTVLGFGMGNLKDATMEKLAHVSNGQYAYIDTFAEAHKIFVEQVGGLVPIAKDVKIQVELNPTWVKAYRLVGYENRLLSAQDFNDDKKDAGDMGAGHSVTALYEIVPPGIKLDLPGIDPLRYQKIPESSAAADSAELMHVKVRYTPPAENKSRLLVLPVLNRKRQPEEASRDFRFAAAVASFAMLLRDSPFKGEVKLADVLQAAKQACGPEPDAQRQEFIDLMEITQRLKNRRTGLD